MSLFAELKRRNVIRVAIFYVVSAWLLLQIVDLIFEVLLVPDWTLRFIFGLLVAAFPFVLFFAWAYEVTPEGIRKESEVDRSATITGQTGRKLDIAVIVVVLAGIAVAVSGRFLPGSDETAETPSADFEGDRATGGSVPGGRTDEAGNKSIAVLPFSNLSNNPETDAFVAGLHDDLLTQLSKIGDLKVIARTSVLEYQDTTRKVSDIGEELGVAHIMEGGVQRAGDRVRLNVQLIDAGTDEHVWAETFDRQLSVANIFDIQSEITREIVDHLQAALSAGESAGIADRPTENLAAYESFLDARLLLERAGTGRFDYSEEAIAAATRATELDPGFADAWGILAMSQLNEFWYYGRDPKWARAAERSIEKGLALDPNSAETRIAAAWYPYWVNFDYATAVPRFETAIELRPGSVSAWDGLASVYRRSGEFDKAVEAFKRALSLNPNQELEFLEIGQTHLTLREFAEAEAILERGLRRFPANHDFQVELARVEAWRTGIHQPLVDALEQRAAVEGVAPYSRFEYVFYEGVFGKTERALSYLEDWSPKIIDVQYEFWPQDLLAAYLHFHSGDRSEASELASGALPVIESQLAEERNNAEIEKARAYALVLAGDTDAAVESAARVRALYPMTLDAFGGHEYFDDAIAIVAMAGATALALEWLEDYQSQPAHRTLASIAADPAFGNVTSTPEFEKLRERFE